MKSSLGQSPVSGRLDKLHDYSTVSLDDAQSALVILDQTCLPNTLQLLHLHKQQEIWQAIASLQVRGAPAIGVAAAMGYYLAAKEIGGKMIGRQRAAATACPAIEFYQNLSRAKDYLASARPTAMNLFWALDRMERRGQALAHQPLSQVLEGLRQEAQLIRSQDIEICRQIGKQGLSLLIPGQGILTHCNAGRLATIQYGTATAPIYWGQEQGCHFRVFVDETRPLLQGARLTAFELQSAGVDVTLICDNMVASVMQQGWVQTVLVGCDRVAANGDGANKIGTAGVAVIAAYYGVPVYLCAPTSTIDLQTATGREIKIEQRPGAEVTHQWYTQPMAPAGIQVYNPAFDVTDHQLIAGIITEYGIARPPYKISLAQIMSQSQQ